MSEEPKQYRHKPTVVKAVKWEPLRSTEVPQHTAVGPTTRIANATVPTLLIANDKGQMLVYPGDYVVYGSRGEVYPVAPEIFEEQYEPID